MKFLKKPVIFLLLFSFCLPLKAADGPLPELPPGPLLLTSVRPEMLEPEYWVQRTPGAEQVLKTPEQIKSFNDDIHAMVKDCVDVFRLSTKKDGKSVRDFIQMQYNAIRGRGLYNIQNESVPKSYFDANIKANLNLEKIPASIPVKWGVATYPVRVRALPTDIKLMEKRDDPEFDMLQFTRLKVWDPVTVLHRSKDGKWVYIQGAYTRGWAEAFGIATVPDRAALQKKLSKFVAVLAESVSVFKDPALNQRWLRVSMGTRLPLEQKRDGLYVVTMPVKAKNGTLTYAKGFIAGKADVSTEFPAFSQANIIRQAFKLLGARYGWAGMYYGRDCSGFIQDVFLSMGLDMPRGSKDQVFVGTQLGHFMLFGDTENKNRILLNAFPGITLLRMPSHQMIYLGTENGQFYVIHCTWAERYSMTSDAKNRINQVVVSDLNLNGRGRIGSLFDRIISISEVN